MELLGVSGCERTHCGGESWPCDPFQCLWDYILFWAVQDRNMHRYIQYAIASYVPLTLLHRSPTICGVQALDGRSMVGYWSRACLSSCCMLRNISTNINKIYLAHQDHNLLIDRYCINMFLEVAFGHTACWVGACSCC